MPTTDDHSSAGAMQSALRIIHGEHRSLASVVQALLAHVRPLRDHPVKPDCEAIATVLAYVETFADRFHHPKEDDHLFRILRGRTRHADAFLMELQHEHAVAPRHLRELQGALERSRGGGASGIGEFAAGLERYARNLEDHLRKEDDIVFPIARTVLTEADWEAVEREFRDNRDPFFGIGAIGPIGGLVPPAAARPG